MAAISLLNCSVSTKRSTYFTAHHPLFVVSIVMTIGDKLNTTAATIQPGNYSGQREWAELRRLTPGDCVAVLGDVIQPGKRCREVTCEGQFAVGVADAQNPQHASARGDHPI